MDSNQKAIADALKPLSAKEARDAINTGKIYISEPNQALASRLIAAKEEEERATLASESLTISRKALQASEDANRLADKANDNARLANIIAIIAATIAIIAIILQLLIKK